ncbi:zinc finger protein [Gracilaria domingensis]|nr:zinc finger protein [Gracilaria domingensis]
MGIGYLLDPSGSGPKSSPSSSKGSMPRSTSAWNLGELQKMNLDSILNSSPGPSNLPPSSLDQSVQSRYVCSQPRCGARFSLFSEIKQHRLASHGLESHQCMYCKTVLAREANLMYHVNSKHKRAGEHWCYKCSFMTVDFSAFKHHMNSVHATRKCSKCGERIPRGNQAEHRVHCHAVHSQEHRGKRGRK